MSTEKGTSDADDEMMRYQLTADELRDKDKMKFKVMSTDAIFRYVALASAASGVPALGAVVNALEGVSNSVERVKSQRKRCLDIKNRWVNLVNIIVINRDTMEDERLLQIFYTVESGLDKFQNSITEWSQLPWWKKWAYRHAIEEKLAEYQAAVESATALVPMAIMTNTVQKVVGLHDELRQAKSVTEQGRIQALLYTMRMDRTLDASDLPGYLDIEVEIVSPKVDRGNRYEIGIGRWLGRDVVALKFPLDFELLRCKVDCRGRKDFCHDQTRHEKAAAAMRRFRRQVDLWRELDHPNVLKLHGWCKINGDIHLVTPWLESGNVQQFAERNELSSIQRLGLIRDIVHGLIYIHGKGVVHGSLSPTNVLVRGDGSTGTALIGDFSVAKIVPPSDRMAVTEVRDDRMIVRYQALEVNLGKEGPGISREADVFAWAMTTLEIISGVMPYPKQEDGHALYQRVFGRREPPTKDEHPSPMWESCPGLWELITACRNDDCDLRPRLHDILTKLNDYINLHQAALEHLETFPISLHSAHPA